ncbi:type II toxin-antitoxin system VapC family toxin [Nostocoides veronense]|uniref:Type II toxin-antitoxin system VapC family toxin n=1 Tax=Nostocoides veronense TaxID=330836 RepID=A0ABN2LDW5_9MICO
MGVNYLLDTHVLLWLLGAPHRVPVAVREHLANPNDTLLVSAVSALEIATKTRVGKLDDLGLVASWPRRIREIGATELAITSIHALTAGSMPWAHRDPFDRLLAAQAIHEGATLVTADQAFRGLPAPRTLKW